MNNCRWPVSSNQRCASALSALLRTDTGKKIQLVVQIEMPEPSFSPVFEAIIKQRGQLRRFAAAALLRRTEAEFSSQFVAAHRITFRKMRCGMRLAMAASILVHSHLRISETAQFLGYSTAQEFRRMFKKQYGRAPILYRARMRKFAVHFPLSAKLGDCQIKIICER